MRGAETKQSSMLCLLSPESVVPANHPIRQIKRLADDALRMLSPIFEAMYSATGRPSIAPERLLKATRTWTGANQGWDAHRLGAAVG